MSQEEKKDQKILITRYLSGELSQEENNRLQKWINFSRDNSLYFFQLKNIWDNTHPFMRNATIDTDKAYKAIRKRVFFKSPAIKFWEQWKKIAAILIIPLVTGNLIYFAIRANNIKVNQEPVYNELFAAFGTRSSFKLSDGTSVWLNSGSNVKYPDRFTGSNRTVFLNGEAYFEVQSNPEKPFFVETSSLTVKATGTKFNVSGYTSANEFEVTLIAGKVDVIIPDKKENPLTYSLDVNQHLSFIKSDRTTSIITDDSYKYVAWKDGKLIFRNESLSEVAKLLSQEFNVDIEIKGSEIRDYKFRATFQDESLEDILKLLKLSSPIDYHEVKRVPLPDGSFPRKKVILFPVGQKIM